MKAPVVIGVPTYNAEATVEGALRSLLAQSVTDLSLVVVDDASSDDTAARVEAIAALDARVHLTVNERRLGMVENWNRALDLSLRRVPDACYFAWGSDHDRWFPRWLAALRDALDLEPDAVLAYPLVERLQKDGSRGGGWRFETRGMPDAHQRLGSTVRDGVAGDMIYGLFRAQALDAIGGYQPVVFPDRLLLGRLALRGTFLQIPEVLWSRQMGTLSTPQRQRTTLFADQVPTHARLPWWAEHPCVLGESAGARWVYARSAGGVALRRPRAAIGRLLRVLGIRRATGA